MRGIAFITVLLLIVSSAFARSSEVLPKKTDDVQSLRETGLPWVDYHFDATGHLSSVSIGRKERVRFDWSWGDLPRIQLEPWTIELQVRNQVLYETLSDPSGAQRRSIETPLTGRRYPKAPAVLDGLADEVEFDRDWKARLRVSGPDDVEMVGLHNESLKIHFVSAGPHVRIGRLPGTAIPVLWDLELPLDIPANVRNVLPTRLIVSARGSVELTAPEPLEDAISAIWVSRPEANHSGVEFVSAVRRDRSPGSVSASVGALMLWACGYNERWSCWTDGTDWYCSNYYEPYYCWSPDPGGSPPPPDTGGGGGGAPPDPRESVRDLYRQYCPTVPNSNWLLDRTQYAANPLSNFFSFDDWRDGNGTYQLVMVDPVLPDKLTQMQAELDTVSLPPLSDPGYGGGYRLPGTDSRTPCGDHCYGLAVDLSIRAANGSHDCHLWNLLAAAAHDVGGWVEPADTIAPNGGVPDHFHVAFDGRTNTDYGDACNN
jgi:hypothetical protein